MIEEIEIRNFKSILYDTIRLSQLTVLLGANGSGKSNLVKALEFLSEIPRGGIAVAVNGQGGVNGIIPKSIARSNIRKTRVFFRYKTRISPPREYPEEYTHKVKGDHCIEFDFPPGQVLRVNEEKVTLHHVLSIAEFFQDTDQFKNLPADHPGHPHQDSSFSIYRTPSH